MLVTKLITECNLIHLTKNREVLSNIWGKYQELFWLCYKEDSLICGFSHPDIKNQTSSYKGCVLHSANTQQLLGSEREDLNGDGYMVDENKTPSVSVAGKYFLLSQEQIAAHCSMFDHNYILLDENIQFSWEDEIFLMRSYIPASRG